MPWWACEFAAVYDGSYYKGKQLLITEFAAINFGEDAYKMEGDKLRSELLRLSVEHRSHGNNIKEAIPLSPLYYNIQRLYVENIDRAWRTWGISGWHYFNFGIGYGNPPEFKGKGPYGRYKCMTSPVTERPLWANPQFDYHAKNMQPLLLYIGGSPTHTDKTHSFFSAGKAVKNVVAVWDGPGNLNLDCSWKLVNSAGKVVTHGRIPVKLKAGDIKSFPIEFIAPEVNKKQKYELKLSASGWKKAVNHTFALQVFPAESPAFKVSRKLTLFDPQKRSQWVKTRINKVKDYTLGQKFSSKDMLVIGKQALQSGRKLPFTAAELVAGLQVVILEQLPEVWDGMGFKTADLMPRVIFPIGKNPAVTGLNADDLRYWRGTADLLPEYKRYRSADVTLSPKSSNRNAVASTVLKIPQAVGFRPLLCGEFDLNYTPLLQCLTGKGIVTYCTLDFSGRVGKDPAATLLADNILKLAANARPVGLKTVFADKTSSAALSRIGIISGSGKFDAVPECSILVRYGNKGNYAPAVLNRFVKAGGTLININLPASGPKKNLYATVVPAGEFGNWATANLFRWRDRLTIRTEEFWQEEAIGRGKIIQVAAAPESFTSRYKNDHAKMEAVQLSVLRLYQLLSRTLTYAGAKTSPALTARLLKLHKGVSFDNLDNWYVFGPFRAGSHKAERGLEKSYPGESQALSGDLNPNFTYRNQAGRILDFRNTAMAGINGFVDLTKAFKTTDLDAVGFAIKKIHSDSNRRAMLRLGVDYFMRVYVNGKLAYDLSRSHGAPKPNIFRIMIKLRKGENTITLKVMSGSKGFGFWANLSAPGADLTGGATKEKELIYNEQIKVRNPYEYHYW